MIRTLEDFVEYSKIRAAEYERDPNLKKHAEKKLLKTPGYSENIITRIGKSSRVMLDSYYEVLRKVQVRGVEYCSVFFSPGRPYKDYDIANDLSTSNMGMNRTPTDEFTKDAIYQVARWGIDFIYVIHQPNVKQIEIGSIILVDVQSGCKILAPLTESFEQFLILIGNLDQIKVNYPEVADDETNDEICGEFLVRLKKLYPELSSEMVAAWDKKLRPVFDDHDPIVAGKRFFVEGKTQMLRTLEDFIEYSKTQAAKYPHLDESKLKTPGYSEKMIETIRKALPGIPESYLQLLRKVKVRGVEYYF